MFSIIVFVGQNKTTVILILSDKLDIIGTGLFLTLYTPNILLMLAISKIVLGSVTLVYY